MFYRHPKRFADYLSWECFGRSLVAGLVAAACFGITFFLGEALPNSVIFVILIGIATSAMDSRSRHPRFFTDFSLIRELQAAHRKGDFQSLLRADLMVWNNQYAISFLIGLFGSMLAVDSLVPGGITEHEALRSGFLYAAVFYFSNAIVWRIASHQRMMRFLDRLKVDYAEQIYG